MESDNWTLHRTVMVLTGSAESCFVGCIILRILETAV
jgi:hypothetical protein